MSSKVWTLRLAPWLVAGLLAVMAWPIAQDMVWRIGGAYTENALVRREIVTLRAFGVARIAQVKAKDGQQVAAGQPLVVFDTSLERAEQDRVRELIDLADDRKIVVREAILAQQQRARSFADALAACRETSTSLQRDRNRTSALNARGLLADVALEKALRSITDNAATCNALAAEQYDALAISGAMRSDLIGFHANETDLRGSARTQLLRIARSTVVAPFDGVVTRKLVSPGQDVTSGQELLTVVSTSEIWIEARLPENRLGRVRLGSAARISLEAQPNVVIPGCISSIEPAVTSTFAGAPLRQTSGAFTSVPQWVVLRVMPSAGPQVLEMLQNGLSARVKILEGEQC
jgi:membrane fusion protein (multidrug efflux system)